MNDNNRIIVPAACRGFVLVSSLIFLVVLTLLVLAATTSSTLEQRMAGHQRAQSRARQAANAALRTGEALLADSAFDTYRRPGPVVAVQDTPAAAMPDVKVWIADNIPGYGERGGARAFLDRMRWAKARVYDSPEQTVKYYIYDRGFAPRDLSPDTAARADGAQFYAITARAQDRTPAARATTQSLYVHYYAPGQ